MRSNSRAFKRIHLLVRVRASEVVLRVPISPITHHFSLIIEAKISTGVVRELDAAVA
jgi:hypothetical protein